MDRAAARHTHGRRFRTPRVRGRQVGSRISSMTSGVEGTCMRRLFAPIALLACVYSTPAFAQPHACDGVRSLALSNTRVTSASAIDTGSFTPPGAANALNNLPPFCRITATLTPTADSDINIEVWL